MIHLSLASTSLIAWSLLLKILLLSLSYSVGMVVVFTLAVNGLSAYRRPSAGVTAKVIGALVAAVALIIIAGSLAWGFYYIIHK
jgi:hypothetical protein